MTRVILAQNDVLTPFDLRAQIFGVNVKIFTYYLEHTRKKKSNQKVTSNSVANIGIKQNHLDN